MKDMDDASLKAELDEIIRQIDEIVKKVEDAPEFSGETASGEKPALETGKIG